MSKRIYILLTMLLVVMLAPGACGGGKTGKTGRPAQESAPLAQKEAVPTEAPANEGTTAEDDVVFTAIDEYLSTIPEGWMSVGDVEKMQEAMDNGAYVIDVRKPGEYAAGHIPGAINIPLKTLARNLDRIPTDQPVITYCVSGHRASMGLSALRSLGYDNARGFPGSWKAWTAAMEEVAERD